MKEIASDEVKSTKLVEELILTKLFTNSMVEASFICFVDHKSETDGV